MIKMEKLISNISYLAYLQPSKSTIHSISLKPTSKWDIRRESKVWLQSETQTSMVAAPTIDSSLFFETINV